MERYARAHLGDQTLLHSLTTHLGQERGSTAEFLADLAEVDARKLYVPAGYPSMYEYCVAALHLSEQAAYRRILVARTARRFPAIFGALADGRLHLTAVVLLAPHLREATADELLAAATHQSRAAIERLLAEWFPRPDLVSWVAPVPTAQLSPAIVAGVPAAPAARGTEPLASPVAAQLSPAIVVGQPSAEFAPAPRATASPRSRVQPLAPGRFAVQFTFSQSEYDDLCYAQALLGHQVPAGDVAPVFARALKALIPQLERQKFAATSQPRPGRRASRADTRHIPAEVKRAVWERDGAQCTFVSKTGHRCSARRGLEFDHVQEYSRGGQATVSGIRLRCRAHNQYEAEQTYGAEFMRHKRLAAAEARASAKAHAEATERRGAVAAGVHAAAATLAGAALRPNGP